MVGLGHLVVGVVGVVALTVGYLVPWFLAVAITARKIGGCLDLGGKEGVNVRWFMGAISSFPAFPMTAPEAVMMVDQLSRLG